MKIGESTPLQQQPKSIYSLCLPRPSFAQQPSIETLSECQSDSTETSTPCCVNSTSISAGLVSIVPFPQCSVNLITCSSNSGKTYFLDQVIRHRTRFFENPPHIKRLVYVNGNQRDFSIQSPWTSSVVVDDYQDSQESLNPIDLEVISLSLDEFGENDNSVVLNHNTVLILDDILKPSDQIDYIVKYGAHHSSLAAVFIVTQSCLSSPLYSLLGAVHNIILIFGNSATSRLTQHLVQTYFLCFETKKFLKSIFGLAEKQQDIVVLKLNTIASNRTHSSILAITHIRHLFDPNPYCIVYPEIGHLENLTEQMPKSVSAHANIDDEYLNEAFVLLPASQVKRVQTTDKDADDSKLICHDEKETKWNVMSQALEEEIQNAFHYKKWNAAKNIARQMLLCSELCISENARTVAIENKPHKLYSIIDFLNVATRKAGPGERPDKMAEYKPLIQVLLRHNIPHSFIINKLLLPGHSRQRDEPNKTFNHHRRHRRRRRRHSDDESNYDYY